MDTSTTDATTPVTVWPVLVYDDARAAIAFLVEAFGFEEVAVYPDERDDRLVVHAELRWPGGGLMLGSRGAGQEPFASVPACPAITYVVTDDPDALYRRAKAAGAEVVRELRDEDYGSRDFSVRDVEGNLWAFGTYAGE
ncbi:glyoxalase [Egibacter rhizosphaerae]|uniref:Glyoxalase n=1 Tax=Egibacter rhizosphaerae TaxID=1670831 RepID=A0A411YC75_9ACTN|nr:VOC family protein [Egibacter rhizosphaerae]QBI18841.1 glyoxalase [Egibacter rhizosphaerae]